MLKLNVPDMILYEKCQYVVLVMRSFSFRRYFRIHDLSPVA